MSRLMKETPCPWIGEIPSDWSIERVKNGFYRKKGAAHVEEPVILSLARAGVKVRDLSKNEGQIAESYYNYNPVEPGDLLLNPMDLQSGANCSISQVSGVISPAYINLGAKKGYDSLFYDYYFKTQYWAMALFAHGKGVSYDNRWTLSADDLMKYYIPVPSFEEQKRISKFLKKQCEYIDSVLETVNNSISEYKKLKQAIISQAVTKGIKDNCSLTDSGNIWFGEIPDTWKLMKLKYIFRIKKDIAGEEGYTVLSITQKGIKPKDLSKNEGQLAADYSNYQLVDPGDFAMNHMDLLTGWVDISQYSGVTSPDYRVFVLKKPNESNSRYYLYFMQMCYSNRIFYGLGQGVSGMGRWRLQADKFLNFFIPVPPLDEQSEIADYLDSKCSEMDKLIEKNEAFVEELENYKKSLVYEYVTGKKEVPQS